MLVAKQRDRHQGGNVWIVKVHELIPQAIHFIGVNRLAVAYLIASRIQTNHWSTSKTGPSGFMVSMKIKATYCSAMRRQPSHDFGQEQRHALPEQLVLPYNAIKLDHAFKGPCLHEKWAQTSLSMAIQASLGKGQNSSLPGAYCPECCIQTGLHRHSHDSRSTPFLNLRPIQPQWQPTGARLAGNTPVYPTGDPLPPLGRSWARY